MIRNNIIVMNRGDSHRFTVDITDETFMVDGHRLTSNDTIYFGLMDPHQMFENALVKKTFTINDCSAIGKLTIELFPEDTLDLLPGTYYYAVKLCCQHEEVNPETGKVIDS